MRTTLCLLTALAVSSVATVDAQSNKIVGMDAALVTVNSLTSNGRLGSFPNGMNGLRAGVSICNPGRTNIDWYPPMDPRHPFYSFIICRESNGRFEQISDWSYVKHGFASINGGLCGTCTTRNSRILGPDCSDTYSSGLNGDPYWLGPPGEIDPWLGAWDPVGSHFDRGEPDVGAPSNMDGRRSLSRTQAGRLNSVTHRIEVADADLNVSGARFYYGSYVVIAGEPGGSNRDNNFIHQETRPTWSGSRWNFSDQDVTKTGTILTRWTGASVTTAGDGEDDGQFYVAVRVTTAPNGLFHYEFALQNRDNSRGGAAFRIPKCPSSTISNVSFRDIDGNAANDWTLSETSNEIAFLAGVDNALEWNTIYNFSFDSNAGPGPVMAMVDHARPGPGSAQISIGTTGPVAPQVIDLGPGCGNPAPDLVAYGSPSYPSIPNASFGVRLEGLAPGASASIAFGGTASTATIVPGCDLYLGMPAIGSFALTANASGQASVPLPVPFNLSLEGADLYCQGFEVQAGGPIAGQFELSNGLRFRVGNQFTSCP